MARQKTYDAIFHIMCKSITEVDLFKNEGTEYRSERRILVRDTDPENIIELLVSKLDVAHIKIHIKNGRGEELVEAKALLAVLMRGLCNAKFFLIVKSWTGFIFLCNFSGKY